MRGLGLFLGRRHRLIYIALILCEHACKTVCDVYPGIDPGPSLARSWHKRYQISGSFNFSKIQNLLRKNDKLLLEQLQFYIFVEIVFGVRCTLKSLCKLSSEIISVLLVLQSTRDDS